MKRPTLPIHIVELAASLFSPRFTHGGLTAHFCNRLGKHPNELSIPDMNKHDKFIWLLGQLPIQEQRRVLEELCSTNVPLESEADRQRLVNLLGSSPIEMPGPEDGKVTTQFVAETWDKARARRQDDPEGAITAARSLLESVCKHILDELGILRIFGTALETPTAKANAP